MDFGLGEMGKSTCKLVWISASWLLTLTFGVLPCLDPSCRNDKELSDKETAFERQKPWWVHCAFDNLANIQISYQIKSINNWFSIDFFLSKLFKANSTHSNTSILDSKHLGAKIFIDRREKKYQKLTYFRSSSNMFIKWANSSTTNWSRAEPSFILLFNQAQLKIQNLAIRVDFTHVYSVTNNSRVFQD